MSLTRTLEPCVRQAAATFPVVVLTGPRQCGKTTLLQGLFGASHGYASLDHPDLVARAHADPVSFLRDHPTPLVLDEVQHAPGLLPYIKAAVDGDRRPGRFVLTGSQSFPLMRGVAESLAGRAALLRLDPFTVAERQAIATGSMERLLAQVFGATDARWNRQDLGAWMLRGGYPEPCLRDTVEPSLWFSSYIDTYLARDVRDLLQVGDLVTFQRFLVLCAARSGRLLNFADLARDVGIAPTTARRWLSVLEASQIVHQVQPWFENYGKRIAKASKLVFLDVGLCAALMGLRSVDAMMHGPAAGALAETAVIAEWIKAFRSRGHEPRVYHWNAHGGVEVDLVVEWDGRLHAIEVKGTATPTPHHAAGLRQWLGWAGPQASGAVACLVERPTALAPDIRAVPWHLAVDAAR
jgi:predicted AAA+ superfamily ATPase